MNAITVRDLPPQVAKFIRDEAHKEGVSLNRVVVQLLEEATGMKRNRKPVVHHTSTISSASGARRQPTSSIAT